MQTLQIRIEPILRIAVAVGRQRCRLDTIRMLAHGRAFLFDGFVDVVAQKKHEFRILVGQMSIGREIAVLVVRAGRDRKAQTLGRGVRRRQGSGAADAACGIAVGEAIPIGPARFEPANVEMHRIGESLLGGGFPTAHDIAQCGIGGDLVAEGDVAAAHAAGHLRIGRQRLRSEPRPQHKAVRPRGSRGDAQAERIARAPSLGTGRTQNERRRHDTEPGPGGGLQKAATARSGMDHCHRRKCPFPWRRPSLRGIVTIAKKMTAGRQCNT